MANIDNWFCIFLGLFWGVGGVVKLLGKLAEVHVIPLICTSVLLNSLFHLLPFEF